MRALRMAVLVLALAGLGACAPKRPPVRTFERLGAPVP